MFLNNPFPHNASFKATVRFSLLAGIVVFLILFLFRPFNIDGASNHFSVLHPLIYGFATFLMVALNSLLLPVIFKSWYREANWTLGKEMLAMCWQIVSIAFINLFITHLLFGEPMTSTSVFKFLFITASVGIFPVGFILLVKQQMLYKKFATGASVIEAELHIQKEVVQQIDMELPELMLTGDNQGELLRIAVRDLRFITAADNYLKVHSVENGQLINKVLRSSLKKAESMLTGHSNLFRCHRAYIVNLSCVVHVSGNAQGLKLHLKNVDELIPVSRSLSEELRSLLQEINREGVAP